MHIDVILCLDVLGSKFTEVYLIETDKGELTLASMKYERNESTHTTLFGFDSRNSRTPVATITIKNNSFHSPEATFSPPGGKLFVRPGANPFEAASRRASASKWSSLGCGNR
jgi:hypothetical protein